MQHPGHALSARPFFARSYFRLHGDDEPEGKV